MTWGLYVHIPFCRRKCFYCDFVSYDDQDELMPRYVEALAAEMRGKKRLFDIDTPPTTVYIGGGTPTVLPLRLITRLLAVIGDIFFGVAATEFAARLRETATEFTIEVNPGTVNEEYLTQLVHCGVNRLSIGAQSFNNELLRSLGRIHSTDDIFGAVLTAKKVGFDNISVDLMYAVPGETLETLRSDIAIAATKLDLQHISVYGLTIEPNTRFAALQKSGKLLLPDDDTVDAMYDYLTYELPRKGFRRYEISNYAGGDGFVSRHNLGYWHFRNYIGVGAAAHSFWRNVNAPYGGRFFNPHSLKEYFSAVFDQEKYCGIKEDILDLRSAIGEFCFLGLRTAEGIEKQRFNDFFGQNFDFFFAPTIKKLSERGAVIADDNHVKLTPLGAKYGNMVFAEFV